VPSGGCLSSRDCLEPETYCDTATRACVDGCEVDDDCMSSARICVAGACADRPCTYAANCAFGEVCMRETGRCEPATGDYCAPCDGGDTASCGSGNLCATLQDADGNDVGAFCLLACSTSGDACPQGYACQELDAGSGPARYCVRRCDRAPVNP
jgi:hypothetical protein